MGSFQRQKEIYLKAMAGRTPKITLDPVELERAASKALSTKAFNYLAGGAGTEATMEANLSAFRRYHILPRMLQAIEDVSTGINLFGQDYAHPIFLAPIGVLDLAHREADCGVAKAAGDNQVPMIFSCQASKPMEEVAPWLGDTPHWFQLYWSKVEDLSKSLVRRAENNGAKAIVLTLDTTRLGWRSRDLQLAYLPFLEGRGIAQYTSDPVFRDIASNYPTSSEGKPGLQALRYLWRMSRNQPGNTWANLRSRSGLKSVRCFIDIYSNPALQWSDIQKLREWTSLPIVIKGVQHPDDAKRAVEEGIDGIIISNHGGRQVDGAAASLDQLMVLAPRVRGKIKVGFDSGIRTAVDAFKALALGADFVLLGRPYAYSLALGGEEGVSEFLKNFIAEFELTMALSGIGSIEEIGPGCLIIKQG